MAPLAKELHKELGRKFNYTDYLAWPDDERWEIIEGVAYDMSPAPSTEHQGISFRLSGILYDFLKDKQCKAFAAPFDVRLAEGKDETDEEIKPLCNRILLLYVTKVGLIRGDVLVHPILRSRYCPPLHPIKTRPRNCCFMKNMASKNIGFLILVQSMS